jgi:hypothetical protein
VKLHLRTLCTILLCCSTTTAAQQSKQAVGNFAEHSIISRDVLVASGDTFKKIAKHELGRAGLAQRLAEFNGLIESAPLAPGQIVRIPIHVPARKEFAQVIFVKGSVVAQRTLNKDASTDESNITSATNADVSNVQMVSLIRNSEVYPGDVINTGKNGFASIEFSSGSVINLQPNTEAKLNQLNCLPTDDSCVIDVRTLRGKVTSNVQTREDQPIDFRISTPYASAAVRGTVFDIQADPDNLVVGVTEGVVDLSSNASDENVALELGFGSVVRAGEAPSPPIALLPSPVFKRIPARMAAGDTISWWPNTQAAKYRALVSTDAAGRDTRSATETSNQGIGFDNIESGDYFLILRAIDDNELRGFTSNTQITIAEIDLELDTVNTSISKQGSEFLVEIVNPLSAANGYEVQISDNLSFDDPLSVDIDPSGTAVFRIDENQVFTRARILMDPFTVSAFGPVASSAR